MLLLTVPRLLIKLITHKIIPIPMYTFIVHRIWWIIPMDWYQLHIYHNWYQSHIMHVFIYHYHIITSLSVNSSPRLSSVHGKCSPAPISPVSLSLLVVIAPLAHPRLVSSCPGVCIQLPVPAQHSRQYPHKIISKFAQQIISIHILYSPWCKKTTFLLPLRLIFYQF